MLKKTELFKIIIWNKNTVPLQHEWQISCLFPEKWPSIENFKCTMICRNVLQKMSQGTFYYF